MTIKELIEELSKYPEDTDVLCFGSDGCYTLVSDVDAEYYNGKIFRVTVS